MPIFTLSDLRSRYGSNAKDLTDEELLQDYAPRVGMDPTTLANKLGYDGGPSTKTRERVSASVDDYQANLYGVAGAAARAVGAEGVGRWADQRRGANEFQADVAQRRAARQGAISRFTDDPTTGTGGVHSLSDFGDYAAGLAIQSAPMMGELAAGALTGGIAAPLALGLRGAEAARAARVGSMLGGAAADYPVAMGDILQNQRQQGGENLGAAALGAIPYTAIDVGTGVGRYVAGGRLARNSVRALDEAQGIGGAVKRMAATGLRTGAEEAAGETAQEGINQYFGRMAVDPSQQFLDENSKDRFLESAIGGGVLGGAFGSVGGGWRRSQGYTPTVEEAPDLLQGPPPAPPPAAAPVAPTLITEPEPLQSRIDQNLGIGISHTPPNYEQQFTDAANEATGHRVSVWPGQVEQEQDAGAESARQAGVLAQQVAVDNAAKEFAQRRKLAHDVLVENDETTGKPAIQLRPQDVVLHNDLVELRDAGKISEGEYAEFAGAVKESLKLNDTKAINAVRKVVAGIKNPKEGASDQQHVPAPAPVAAGATAGRSDQSSGSVGAVGQVPDAGAGPTDGAAAAPAPSNDAAGAVGVGRQGPDAAVAAPVISTKRKKLNLPKDQVVAEKAAPEAAPPAVEAPAKPKFRRVPKAEALAPPPAPKPLAPRPARVEPRKFNNVPDLADAVAKENGLSEKHAKAYVDNIEMGRSLSKIAVDLGVGKSTAGDMVKAMKPLMDAARVRRLEATAEDVVAPDTDLAAEVEAAVAPGQEAGEEDNNPHETTIDGEGVSYKGDEAIQVDDEGVVDVAGEPAQTGISVRSGKDSGAEVLAHSDPAAEAAAKKKRKLPDSMLKPKWDALTEKMPKGKKVKWEKLGEGQKLMFEEGVKAKNMAETHLAVSESVYQDGLVFSETANRNSTGVNNAEMAGLSKVRTVRDMLDQPANGEMLELLYPALLKSKKGTGLAAENRALDPVEKAHFHAAVVNLLGSKAKSLIHLALQLIDSVNTFDPGPETAHIGGFFNVPTNSVTINARYLPGPAMLRPGVDKRRAVYLAEVLAHELTHALDAGAAEGAWQGLGPGPFISMSDTSPTSATITKAPDSDEGLIEPGPVLKEAMDAYHQEESDALSVLDQPLLDLYTHLVTGPVFSEKLVYDTEVAAYELPPRLVEMYLTDPELLKARMPLGYAYAEKLANATSYEEVAQILGGLDGVQSQDDAGASGPGEEAPGDARSVRGEVQGPPADVARAERRGVPGAHSEVLSRREAGAGANPQVNDAGRQAGDRLTAPPLAEPNKLVQWLKSLVSDKLYRNHPGLLGWLSTEQLATAFPELKAAEGFSKAMQRMGGAASQMMHASDHIAREWAQLQKKLGAPASAAFDALVNRSTRTQIWPNKDLSDPAQAHLDRKDPRVQAAHAELARMWAATPVAYKDIFERMQADHKARFERFVAAQRGLITETYYPPAGASAAVPSKEMVDRAAKLKKSERGAFLDEHATSKVASDTYRSLFDALDEQAKISRLVGPYAPQARFGDHIVSYKSPEYVAAEKALADANDALQTLHEAENYKPIADLDTTIAQDLGRRNRTKDTRRVEELTADIAAARAERDKLLAPIEAARQLVLDRTEALNALKADPNAYGVEFHENRGQAVAREAQLKAFFGTDGTEVKRTLRDQYLTQQDAITPAWVKRMEEHLTSALTGADAQEVRRTIRELYLQHLPGTSVLKSQIKRKNVPGIKDSEAHRSFANKAMRDAYGISRMEHSPALHENLQLLRGSDDEDAKLVGNELAKRIAQNFTMKTNKLISFATNVTYFSTLGLSPGFMLMQGTQQWIITAPMMAARHGMGAIDGLRKGTADAAKLLKISLDSSKTKMSFDVDIPAGIKAGILTAEEGRVLRDMFDRGRIDITTAHDLGIASAGQEGGVIGTAVAMSNWPVQQLETINRISTALAGFRAEKAAGIKGGLDVATAYTRALAYADKLVSETHMNYNSENRARFLHPSNWGGWGRVMFQFRAYQQGMAYLTIKNLVDALRGDKEARRAVAYLAGVQLATAGVAGLPVPGAMVVVATMLYKLWEDDDDEKDLKEMFFQGVKSAGGEEMARLVTGGVPALVGVNLSQKIGMGNIFDLAPFVSDTKEGRDLVGAYWMATTAGPAGGMVANYAEAVKQAGQGEFVKATTLMLPKVAADIMRAYDYQARGMTDNRGNTILTPEDLSGASTALKAVGLQSEDVNRTMDQRSAFFEARQNRNDVRARLLQRYAHAVLHGEDVSDIREEIDGFNARHPDARIAPGSLPIAVKKRREYERNLRHGVPVGKRERVLAEEVGVSR